MVTHYKCPNCGSDMAFDTASGMLKCDSCSRKDSIENIAGLPDTPIMLRYHMIWMRTIKEP